MREAGVIDAPDAVRDGARYLEARSTDSHTLVVVHRTEDIAKNLGGDTRKALRQALGALEEDPTQLEALLKLTEKVIFDSDDVVRTTPLRPTTGPGGEQEAGQAPASLALSAARRKSSARRTRTLASGDIVVLLDALMRRLGEGLTTTSSPRPRSEEEEIGADDRFDNEIWPHSDHEFWPHPGGVIREPPGAVAAVVRRVVRPPASVLPADPTPVRGADVVTVAASAAGARCAPFARRVGRKNRITATSVRRARERRPRGLDGPPCAAATR